MSKCLNERTLLLLVEGEGTDSQKNHLSACDTCTSRSNALVRDLETLRQTLRQGPPAEAISNPLPRFRSRWLPAGVALAMTLALAWPGVRTWTRPGSPTQEGNRSGDARGILDDLPANLLLATEALALELATEGHGSFDLAATVLDAERPCEWYDLAILNRTDEGNEALEVSGGNNPASCVEINPGKEKRPAKTKSAKKSPKQRTEESR